MACPISSSLAGSPTILVMGARELRRECAGGRNCARVDSPHPLRARLELCPARAGDRNLGLYHRIKVVVALSSPHPRIFAGTDRPRPYFPGCLPPRREQTVKRRSLGVRKL